MSTRSGKRIHASFHENEEKKQLEHYLRSERKTRNKHPKDNCEVFNVTMPKLKKRENYVRYPSDSENDINDMNHTNLARRTRTHTLKEHNIDDEIISEHHEVVKVKKEKGIRRNKKKVGNIKQNQIDNVCIDHVEKPINKNILVDTDINRKENDSEDIVTYEKKNKKRSKKAKQSGTADDDDPKVFNEEKPMSDSKISVDSFHSAAGSPSQNNFTKLDNKQTNSSFEKIDLANTQRDNNTIEKDKITRNSTIEASSKDKILTYHENYSKTDKLNSLSDKESGIKNKIDKQNETFEKQNKPKRNRTRGPKQSVVILSDNSGTLDIENKGLKLITSKHLHNSFDPIDTESLDTNFNKAMIVTSNKKSLTTRNINGTVENKSKNRKRTRTLSPEQVTVDRPPENLSCRVKKTNETKTLKSLDTTFEKEDNKLDTTLENIVGELSDDKSSITTSDDVDGMVNTTFDKTENNVSRISITSDESKENILNATPVLIESSMDETLNKVSPILKTSSVTPLKREGTYTDSTNFCTVSKDKTPPITPMKREGTFTKEGPVMCVENNPTISIEKTPTRKMSLPTAGCTPFHSNHKSGQKKTVLNVTHSIEKIDERSLIHSVDAPRATRVMFCSPVDNPIANSQRKSKIVKSSLKGSNKSFLFEENGTPPVRPASRKRSLTHNDAEDLSAKRKRFADELPNSATLLSQNKTNKLDKTQGPTTPSKRAPILLSKSETKISRTKLPNFAALHQRRFDKMESLDECQDRKAKRARQMLTPTGCLNLLERTSPKDLVTTAPPPLKAVNKTESNLKTDTPTKPPKIPTLETLKPGYTRFGFKMNCNDNPFSIPSKRITKNKKEDNLTQKPIANTIMKREPTLPSMSGATVTRKEIAKNVMLRENSITSKTVKRNVDRKEVRTIIKGVRTNRRFDLLMKSRNMIL